MECHLPQAKDIKSDVQNQETDKRKSNKKSLKKIKKEQMKRMEEMSIGLVYREYIKA